jgi:hypothetical protein
MSAKTNRERLIARRRVFEFKWLVMVVLFLVLLMLMKWWPLSVNR